MRSLDEEIAALGFIGVLRNLGFLGTSLALLAEVNVDDVVAAIPDAGPTLVGLIGGMRTTAMNANLDGVLSLRLNLERGV